MPPAQSVARDRAGDAAAQPDAPSTTAPAAMAAPSATVSPRAIAVAAMPTPRPIPHIALTVDAAEVDRGACTMLRWSVSNAVLVALDGQDVPDSGTREVCPAESATYTLVVTPFSGYDEQRWVSVKVRGAVAQAGKPDDEDDAPPPPPTATPCDVNCIATLPPPEEPGGGLEPLPTLPPAGPPGEPTVEPPPPPEPTEEPPAPPPPPEPTP